MVAMVSRKPRPSLPSGSCEDLARVGMVDITHSIHGHDGTNDSIRASNPMTGGAEAALHGKGRAEHLAHRCPALPRHSPPAFGLTIRPGRPGIRSRRPVG